MKTELEIRNEVYESLAPSPDGVLVSDSWIDKEVEKRMAKPTVDTRTRAVTDWEAELRDEDVVENNEGKKIVLLRGLQRLSRLAGIKESYPEALFHVVDSSGRGMVQCVYITKWNDGSVFGGTADVNRSNVNEDFAKFPTTIAESRAEGRAIRKALGITLLTAEELDSADGFTGATKAENGKADSAQVAAIEKLIEDLGIEIVDVITQVADGEEIVDLADLTPAQAVEAMRYLNSQRGKSKRAARKTALKKQVGDT